MIGGPEAGRLMRLRPPFLYQIAHSRGAIRDSVMKV